MATYLQFFLAYVCRRILGCRLKIFSRNCSRSGKASGRQLTSGAHGSCPIVRSGSSSFYAWGRNVMRDWGNKSVAPGYIFTIFRVLLSWFSYRHYNVADAGISQFCKLVTIQEAIRISLNWFDFNHITRFYVAQITLRSSSTTLIGLTGLRLCNTCFSSLSQSRSGTTDMVAPTLAS